MGAAGTGKQIAELAGVDATKASCTLWDMYGAGELRCIGWARPAGEVRRQRVFVPADATVDGRELQDLLAAAWRPSRAID